MAKGGGGASGSGQQVQSQPFSSNDARNQFAQQLAQLQLGAANNSTRPSSESNYAAQQMQIQAMKNRLQSNPQASAASSARPTSMGGLPIFWGTGGPTG